MTLPVVSSNLRIIGACGCYETMSLDLLEPHAIISFKVLSYSIYQNSVFPLYPPNICGNQNCGTYEKQILSSVYINYRYDDSVQEFLEFSRLFSN
eukprot:403349873